MGTVQGLVNVFPIHLCERVQGLSGCQHIAGAIQQPTPSAIGILMGENLMPQRRGWLIPTNGAGQEVTQDQVLDTRAPCLQSGRWAAIGGVVRFAVAGDGPQREQAPHRGYLIGFLLRPSLTGELAPRTPGAILVPAQMQRG